MNEQHDIWDELELASAPESLGEEMYYLISAYADGECSPKERRLVEAYLAERREAQEMLAEIRSQTALIGSERCEPPTWLRQAILDSTTRRPRLVRRIVCSRPVAFAASASAVVALAVLFWPDRPADAPMGDVFAVTDSHAIQVDLSPNHTGGAVNPHAADLPVVSDAEHRSTGAVSPVVHTIQPPPATGSGRVPSGEVRPDSRNVHGAGPAGSSSTPSVRMGPESGPVGRVVPDQLDVVALAGMSPEGEESVLESHKPDAKAAEPGKDPREDLRKRLRELNQDSDVQDAFKGGK